jgi:hypothetical protein
MSPTNPSRAEVEGGDEFERAFGRRLPDVLDTDAWVTGPDLGRLYEELERQVTVAANDEERRRADVQSRLIPRLRNHPRAITETGLHSVTPAMVELAHNGLLFSGAVAACDGTSDTHDTLPITITQIGVGLVNYHGPSLTWAHQLFRMDFAGRMDDPDRELEALLSARRGRAGVGVRTDGDISELARRGIQAYAERAILLEKATAHWRMGHGNPTPYELLTGYWASRPAMIDAGLSAMERLVEYGRFLYVPSAPGKRELLTLGYALEPLQYLILWDVRDDLNNIIENGGYERSRVKPRVEAFRDHVGPQVVVGLYRATADAPPQLFYAHRDHVHVAAQIAIADSVLVGHRGFPLLLDTADRICAAEFGGRRLEVAVQQVYAKLDLPYRYLGERETRR